MERFLAVDIGNSNVVCGIYERDDWTHIWRLQTSTEFPSAYYINTLSDLLLENQINPNSIKNIGISSVVPSLNTHWEETCTKLFKRQPFFLNPELFGELEIHVNRPYEIGSDLVANAYAAHYIYKDNCIIVDFGTALTFTAIGKGGIMQGVNILPGLKTAMAALSKGTAQLPEAAIVLPESLIGTDTLEAIQVGVLWGYVGLVERMLERLSEYFGEKYLSIATGGLSSVLDPLHDTFDHINKNLTLDGIRMITVDNQ